MQKQRTRRWWSTDIPNLTIGFDLGDKYGALCHVDGCGEVVRRGSVGMREEALRTYFGKQPRCRVVIEASTHSPWVSRVLEELGHEVIVANPSQIRNKGRKKNDPIDAEYLARQGRADPALLHPIQHRGAAAQAALVRICARDALVRSRTLQVNNVRGLVKSFGGRIPSCSAESFHRTARQHLPEAIRPALEAMLQSIASLTQQIRRFDAEIERMCEEEYQETKGLRQIAGVGALTALAYVLVIEDPGRFRNRRSVGDFVGLVPKLKETGGKGKGPELSISKAGNKMLRRLMVGSANYILGPFGPETDLRRWGLHLAERGGKKAKRRATVAVARKLAVLLHKLWVSGEAYVPLRPSSPHAAAGNGSEVLSSQRVENSAPAYLEAISA